MNISVLKRGSEIKVTSPFNLNFVDAARNLGGTWSKPHWVFDFRDEARVRDKLIDIFGTDGSPDLNADVVTLRVTAHDGISQLHGAVVIAGRVVAQAWSRDSDAKLGEGVVFLSGGAASGGSVENWRTFVTNDSVFEIRDVPRAKALKTIEDNQEDFHIEVIDDLENNLQSLRDQKGQLEERLAVINSEIEQYESAVYIEKQAEQYADRSQNPDIDDEVSI